MPHLNGSGCARRPSRWGWVLVIVLSALAGALLGQVVMTQDQAQAQVVTAGSRASVFAVAGQLSRDAYGVFLVDSSNSTMAIYEWVPDKVQGRKLKLVASRSFFYDLQLDEYNTEPSPRDIKALAEQNKRLHTQPALQP